MHRHRFTGSIDQNEFERRCSEHPLWYHRYDFDNGFQVAGMWDIGADIEDYGFPDSLEGKTILDIGTGSGWFAMYFWQRGASVTATDVRGYCDFDYLGVSPYAPFADSRQPDRYDEEGRPVYFSPVSGGFWIMKDLLKAPIRFVNARAYDIRPELFGGMKFDIVFLGSLLCHLRDPIGALVAARSVCNGLCIASTPIIPNEPEDQYQPRQYLPYMDIDPVSWWMPNEACYRRWFLAAGFSKVDIQRTATLRCDASKVGHKGRIVNQDMLLRVAHALP